MFLKDDNVEFYNGIKTLYGTIETIHDDGTYDIYSIYEDRTYYNVEKIVINEAEKYFLKTKDIKRFLKLEITQKELFNDSIYLLEFEKESDINITLEELQYALNVYNGTKTNREFINDFAIGLSYFIKEKDFFKRDEIIFNDGIPELDSFISNFDFRFKQDLTMNDKTCDFDEYIYDIDRYFLNEDKPMAKWKYSNYMKSKFVEYYYSHQDKLNENQNLLKLFKKYVVELAEINNRVGLYVLGYASYERGHMFRVDYKKSYECIYNLYSIYHDKYAPVSLGYMFYYGRLNNGKPDYFSSFHYFNIAMSMDDENIEAIYKVADHYIHGYGVVKDLKMAFNLLEGLYLKLYHDIENEIFENEFVQVSYRMAQIYYDRDSMYKDYYKALEILLMAKKVIEYSEECRKSLYKKTIDDVYNLLFAIRERFIAEENIFENRDKYFVFGYPHYFNDNLCRGYELLLSITKKEDESYILKVKQKEENKKLLCSLPLAYYSTIADEISFSINSNAKFLYNGKEFTIDKEYNFTLYSLDEGSDDDFDSTILYDKDRNSLRILTDEMETLFSYDKDDFFTYTIVTVKFDQSQNKTYDYISSSDNTEIGDVVKVLANNIEKEVIVTYVKKIRKIDLKLPLSYYKKTL